MAIAHVALDLGLGDQRGYRVDHHNVDGVRSNEHVRDLEGLLAVVWLGDEQLIGLDAHLTRVD